MIKKTAYSHRYKITFFVVYQFLLKKKMNITDITSQDEVKPLALQCADPHVYFHTDGNYYFTYMRHRELPLAILVNSIAG